MILSAAFSIFNVSKQDRWLKSDCLRVDDKNHSFIFEMAWGFSQENLIYLIN